MVSEKELEELQRKIEDSQRQLENAQRESQKAMRIEKWLSHVTRLVSVKKGRGGKKSRGKKIGLSRKTNGAKKTAAEKKDERFRKINDRDINGLLLDIKKELKSLGLTSETKIKGKLLNIENKLKKSPNKTAIIEELLYIKEQIGLFKQLRSIPPSKKQSHPITTNKNHPPKGSFR